MMSHEFINMSAIATEWSFRYPASLRLTRGIQASFLNIVLCLIVFNFVSSYYFVVVFVLDRKSVFLGVTLKKVVIPEPCCHNHNNMLPFSNHNHNDREACVLAV